MSLKERIYNYLRQWYDIDTTRWIHKGDLSDCGRSAGYSSENVGRRLRELENELKVEVHYNEKGHAMYRFKPMPNALQSHYSDFVIENDKIPMQGKLL